jgi:hypothetical protein
MEPPKAETVMSPDQLMALAMVCVIALLVIFVLLALVRTWGLRMQQQRGGCGGLDIETLRRQRDSGEITRQEFDRIVAGIAGDGAGTAPRPAQADSEGRPPGLPIKDAGDPAAGPDRSNSDDQG